MNNVPEEPVIIVSTKPKDKTTDIVLSYLNYYNSKFVRNHSVDKICDLSIKISNLDGISAELTNEERRIFLGKNSPFWYRRGDFSIEFAATRKDLNCELQKYFAEEWGFIKYFLHNLPNGFGNYYDEISSNKLVDLRNASQVGLNIPNSLITTEKKELIKFYRKYQQILTKPIHNSHISYIEDEFFFKAKGVVLVDEQVIQSSEKRFMPSLFQEYIDKIFEIRIFFIGDELYAMAIFSQNDEKTKFDYRNYNKESPNRNVPYSLPTSIEKKIKKFIEVSQLSTGSIDLILDNNYEYFFLEVNPVGQFGWVSANCNYYLEKKVAQNLIKLSDEKEK